MVSGGGGVGEVGSTNASETTDFNLVNFDNGAGCVEEDEDNCRLKLTRLASAVISRQVVDCSWGSLAFRWLREYEVKLK